MYLIVVPHLTLSPVPVELDSSVKERIKEEEHLQIKAEDDEGRASTIGGTVSGTEFDEDGSDVSVVG